MSGESLPWLAPALAQVLTMQKAHAVLLHAATGAGSLQLAGEVAAAWLCESAAGSARPCGACAACRLVGLRSHPDLTWLVPEELRVRLGWLGGEDGAGEGADASDASRNRTSRKPSKQIRIDEVRAAIGWIIGTSSRGRAKVLAIHPAEALNPQAANALLKTLEEPPRGVHIVLTAAEPERLLPTVLSRCQRVRMPAPAPAEAVAWLATRGLVRPEVLLAAAGGLPLDALALAANGVDAAAWAALPGMIVQGRPGGLASWPVPRVVDALQKLCHDSMCRAAGGEARFFPPAEVPSRARLDALAVWATELSRLAARAEHPFSEPLLLDALLVAARRALAAPAQPRATLRS